MLSHHLHFTSLHFHVSRIPRNFTLNFTYTLQSKVRVLLEKGEAAKKILVRANMRLVFHISRYYRYRGVAYPDLVQEGTFGELYTPIHNMHTYTHYTHYTHYAHYTHTLRTIHHIHHIHHIHPIGLIKAVDKYDPEKGFRFSTYASWWIKQSVSRYAVYTCMSV